MQAHNIALETPHELCRSRDMPMDALSLEGNDIVFGKELSSLLFREPQPEYAICKMRQPHYIGPLVATEATERLVSTLPSVPTMSTVSAVSPASDALQPSSLCFREPQPCSPPEAEPHVIFGKELSSLLFREPQPEYAICMAPQPQCIGPPVATEATERAVSTLPPVTTDCNYLGYSCVSTISNTKTVTYELTGAMAQPASTLPSVTTELAASAMPPVSTTLQRPDVVARALDKNHCKLLQLEIQDAQMDQLENMAAEILHDIGDLCRSKNGNFVLQALIERLPTDCLAPIVRVCCDNNAPPLYNHKIGCRIYCSLVEQLPSDDELLGWLLEPILVDPTTVCNHKYAHHVVESWLDNHGDDHQSELWQLLEKNKDAIKDNRYGKHVYGRITEMVQCN